MEQLSRDWSIGLLVSTLFIFVLVAFFAEKTSLNTMLQPTEKFISARKSVKWIPLGISYYASAVGTWVLFIPPEVSVLYGCWPIIFYAIGIIFPMIALIWLAPLVHSATGDKGFVLTDFISERYGTGFHIATAFISLIGMWTSLCSELSFIGRAAVLICSGMSSVAVVLPVVLVTMAYSMMAGLKTSIFTDSVQGCLVVFTGLLIIFSATVTHHNRFSAASLGRVLSWNLKGLVCGLVVCISFFYAYLMDQGAWQRVWAAESEEHNKKALVLSVLLSFPTLLLFGLCGPIASAISDNDPINDFNASTVFFRLSTPDWLAGLTFILVITMTCSTVDTLYNAMPALIGAAILRLNWPFNLARFASFSLTIPAIVVALKYEGSVVTLLLIGNVIASAVVAPVFLGLWNFPTRFGAVSGFVGGLLSIFFFGLAANSGSVVAGFYIYLLPGGPSRTQTLLVFIIAPVVSTLVVLAVSTIERFYDKSIYNELTFQKWLPNNKCQVEEIKEEKQDSSFGFCDNFSTLAPMEYETDTISFPVMVNVVSFIKKPK